MMHTRTFRCMTTDLELILDAENGAAARRALADAESFFHSVEARFSRFLPDSELSLFNSAGPATGAPFHISAGLAELIMLAQDAAEASAGVFDPTIIDALEAAGYDRSIDTIRLHGTTVRLAPSVRLARRWRQIHVEAGPDGWTATRPEGIRLDLGGIAKGWAADKAADLFQALGPGLVNAGGDLRAWGDQPGAAPGQGWLVAVDHPQQPGNDAAWLSVSNGAAATSSMISRRWAGGHHLIDPRTARPAETDLVSVTALAPTAAQAEVAAKVVLIVGREPGLAWLAGQAGTSALLAGDDGQYYGTPDISRYFARSDSLAG
jgi:FAD:protein FMN transferase